ncbi:hypothetical protein HLB44_28470 [Aquincola sp. S2]|uniref:Cellulose biosynthesis protein BcsS n=1 Tax=Pseudaquabacterium terrae TaxID=2732868 RepID=A0ABX2EQL7_9BURK|nr:hypothetical protein [Aquabacterium terrae]NRF70947.1 hypothetical protein [Aquabacterium terrae]
MPMPRLAALVPLLAACAAAHADPGYYVLSSYGLAPGTSSAELRYWTVKPRGEPERIWPELGIGHAVSSRWSTLLLASFIGSSNLHVRSSLWSWQNNLQLTQGEWPVDLALHANLIRPAERANGHTLEFGPLLQTDVGRVQLNANLLFERRFGADAPRPTQLKYQWQFRHRWRAQLHWGLQGFGELGEWDHWAPRDRQSHRGGPALFASLPLSPGVTLKTHAALLIGSTYRDHGRMLSLRMACEF